MRVTTLDIDPANVNTVAIVTEAVVDAAGAVTINGAGADVVANVWTSADGLGRRLVLDQEAAVDNPNAVVTITGKDADGRAQTDTFTNIEASGDIETTTKYFSSVSAVEWADVEAAEAIIDIGTNGELASKTVPLDHYDESAPMVSTDVTGTMNWTVEACAENLGNFTVDGRSDFNRIPAALRLTDQNDLNWVADANHATDTADEVTQLSRWPMTAIRVITASYTDSGELKVTIAPNTN